MAYIQPWKCVKQKHNTQSSQTPPSPWSLLRVVVLRVRVGVGRRLCRCLGRHPLTELAGRSCKKSASWMPMGILPNHSSMYLLMSRPKALVAAEKTRVIHIWRIHGQLVHHRGRRLGNLRLHGAWHREGFGGPSQCLGSRWPTCAASSPRGQGV